MQSQRPALVAEQRQKLNPRMLQSIKILAMPVGELKEEIRSELELNPALEVIEDRTELSLDSFDEERSFDELPGWAEDSADYSYNLGHGDEDSKRRFLEGAVFLPETLQDHLLSQLGMVRLEPVERELGERLIQNLDDNGFNLVPPEELCPACDPELLRSVVAIVRSLDPAGTCTANYRESLVAQAEGDPEAPRGTIPVLREHLDALERGRLAEIRKALGLKEQNLAEIIEYIKTLSPFPGRRFSTDKTRYVVPDLAIRVEDGEIVIELNDEIIPVLGINPFMSELSAKRTEGREAASFAKENVERAKFFIGSIQQRNQTLLKVAKSIARFQSRFFVEGPTAMQPLTLKDVADEIGVHETTVSRIGNGKYVQTEWGIFELRRFFTNAVPATASSNEQHSKEGVKAVLKEILESDEEGAKSKSDRELVDILARRGIKIARRTVAKYRGELDMDSSFGRRKH